ncbi:GTPase-activating protein and VPS9 domain-containing protein 1-like [Gigantopelta aegis]|uniref:GTPase-activating protein and VPS9 domain-containing protein 1-like n=1 Tax=Gigantopelta aegis TaxID=1735272 RepID=UPI001B88C41E|nr:GTPase-activating protein and VPS9 domain-containing protein 1-like [Gigantopelta aegis]
MSLFVDLIELGQHLRQERLFANAEREQLQGLYENVRKVGDELCHVSWIAREQKVNLNTLVLLGHELPSEEICAKNNQLERVSFIDSYKQLSHHDAKFGELFKFLRENPFLLSHLICASEKQNVPNTLKSINVIISAIYGNCVLQEDEIYVLQLLKILIELGLGSSDNPRRVVRRGNSAFSVIFKQLSDSLFSTRLFLTAALHDPVMRLLMEDEWFYDIDPTKALVRFPAKERLRRFGEPGTEDYKTKLQNYRKFIVDKLVLLSNRFISSIKVNLQSFPSSLSWLVGQVFQSLTKSTKVSSGEARATCADLVFAMFICPAICDPEPYGITSDVPISHIARHNLMQMAQIIQVLAISHPEEIDPKTRDLYGRFEKGCMSSFLDALVDGVVDEIPVPSSNQLQNASRSIMLLTRPELDDLVVFLKNGSQQIDEKIDGKKMLDDMLMEIPTKKISLSGGIDTLTTPATPPLGHTPPGTPGSQRKLFKNIKKKNSLSNILLPEEMNKEGDVADGDGKNRQVDEVLVLSFGVPTECPGMLSESKILSWEQENRRRRVKYNPVLQTDNSVHVVGVEIQEKRTRFSLSHDQESLGNTSDYQEAISEAASSHSFDQDNDLENDINDNFSDMMSANVSGRGSPSISGRDTPLSQVGSVEERPPTELPVPVPETVRKQNREDVTERFGKFEIKAELENMLKDDTKSTVSDTWSTDVLASDSEPPEQNQLERLEEVAEDIVRPFLLVREPLGENPFPGPVSEISETASESAWSTDVLASDTDDKQSELLTDLEQEEMTNIMERSDLDSMEETPLASGGHSPTGDRDMEGLGAEGGRGAECVRCMELTKLKSDNSLGPDEEEVFTDEPHERCVSSIIENFQQISPSSLQERHLSDSLKAAEGRVKSVLLTLDPHSTEEHNKGDNLRLPKEVKNVGARPKEFVRKPKYIKHHRGYSADKVAAWARTNGPDVPATSDLADMNSIDTDDSAKDDFHVSQTEIVNTGEVSKESDTDEGIVMSVDVESVTEGIESLKVTEQQNTNLGQVRLSAALSMFDPLSPEMNEVPPLTVGGQAPRLSTMTTTPALTPTRLFSESNDPAQRTKSEILISISKSEDVQSFVRKSHPDITIETLHASSLRRDSSDSSHSASSLHLNDGVTKDSSGDNVSQKSSGDSVSMKSDEKEFSENDERSNGKSGKKGFFKSVRDKINKGIKRRTIKNESDLTGTDGVYGRYIHGSAISPSDGVDVDTCRPETSDDILDKYRKKASSDPMLEESSDLTDSAYQSQSKEDKLASRDEEDMPPFYDPANLETCFAFQDAKRKLRMVLSTADFQQGINPLHHLLTDQAESPREGGGVVTGLRKDNELITLLRAQLAEAINLQNKDTVAQLHEVIRCIRQFDNDGCKKLVKALREEYRNRSAYISYLVRCRQGLLMSLSHLQQLLNRAQRDKEICNKHMVNVCVRLFIEHREKQVLYFISDFQKLTVSDEKTDLVERFLQLLYKEMEQDAIWKAATQEQMDDARLAIERLLMSRIYTHAMFPNGDGDFMRDQIIHQHIKKLSVVITPVHKDLGILRMYHFECPWPAAQREIYMINAYKTPKDKLQCVLRCSMTIMNLLSMANEKSVPAADDFMPVLIFVIIKANPPCLLSTIQYVNSFYENRLGGEEQYWWMQFASAVEFIKTMDYSE